MISRYSPLQADPLPTVKGFALVFQGGRAHNPCKMLSILPNHRRAGPGVLEPCLRMPVVRCWDEKELPYPSDLTVAQWALIEPLLPAAKLPTRRILMRNEPSA